MDLNSNKQSNKDNNGKRRNKLNILLCVAAAVFAICLIFFLNSEIQRNTEKEITYTKFIEMLKKDQIEKVTFKSNLIYIEPKTEEKVAMFTVTYYTGYVNDTSLIQDMLNKYGVEFKAEVPDTGSGVMEFLLTYILPIAGLWLLLWILYALGYEGRRTDGRHRQVQCQDVCGEKDRRDLCRCGRRGGG